MMIAIVIGSGLSGLVAALRMQRRGYRVRILEQRQRPGGLCGTQELDGYEFALACNDFGSTLAEEMRELEVPIDFHRPQTRFCFAHRTYVLPLTLRGSLPLLPRLPGIIAFARGLRGDAGYLGPLVSETVRNPKTADLVNSLAYPLGICPDRLALSILRAQFSREYSYGYDRPHTPIGGPGALVGAIVRCFEERGGTLELGITCDRVESRSKIKIVHTSDGERTSDCVISSVGRWREYPARLTPSLAVNMLLFAVSGAFEYPPELHTMVHFPPNVARWMDRLERGEQPSAFGFHVFRSDLARRQDHYTLNVFTLAPRGVEHLEAPSRERVQDYVVRHLDALLAGFSQAISYQRFLSAGEFRQRTGLSTHLTPRVVDAEFEKPPIYDPRNDVYYVGNSVYPPGEHAGSAVLSAKLAAAAAGRRGNAR